MGPRSYSASLHFTRILTSGTALLDSTTTTTDRREGQRCGCLVARSRPSPLTSPRRETVTPGEGGLPANPRVGRLARGSAGLSELTEDKLVRELEHQMARGLGYADHLISRPPSKNKITLQSVSERHQGERTRNSTASRDRRSTCPSGPQKGNLMSPS